ncbi:MAG: outer membrane lipoprotein LolB [Hydrogenophilales bacterium 28-61-23]|nr:MAG: outer membrane lipoprotein LolB [Hydrogenophilales bacterium 28-61-23]
MGVFRRGNQAVLPFLLALGLTACSHWPGFQPEESGIAVTLPAQPAAFHLDGRVSVKAGEESFSGGLVWRRDVADEELLLRTPLGQGIAELRGGPAGMELKDAEGRLFYAADADALVRKALGLELPLRGLAWWVVGLPRPAATYRARPDADGRLGELEQDGWLIYFSRYELHNNQFHPGKLVARRGDDLEVRLVIDSWKLP